MNPAATSGVRAPHPEFLAAGGETGALIRAADWSATPLGAPDAWPEGLRLSVRLMLSSRLPMAVFWGPHLIQFYNDGCRSSLGPDKHADALGKPALDWLPEGWATIRPQLEFVISGQGSSWRQEDPVPILRGGKLHDVWWTYGCSPLR